MSAESRKDKGNKPQTSTYKLQEHPVYVSYVDITPEDLKRAQDIREQRERELSSDWKKRSMSAMAHILEATPLDAYGSVIIPARCLGRGFVTALAESISNSRTFEFNMLDGSSVTLVVRNARKEWNLIRHLEERFKYNPTEPINAIINPRVSMLPIDLNYRHVPEELKYHHFPKELNYEYVMQVEPDEKGVSKVFFGYTAYSIKFQDGKYIMSRDDSVKPGPSYVDPKDYCNKLQKVFSDHKRKWDVSRVPMPRYHPSEYVSSRREIWSMRFTKYLGKTLLASLLPGLFEFKLSTGEKKWIVLGQANRRLAKSLDEAFEKNPAIIHYLTGDIEQSEGIIHYPYHSDTLQFVRNHDLSLNIVFEGKEYCLKSSDIEYIDSYGVKTFSNGLYFILEAGQQLSSYEAKIRDWESLQRFKAAEPNESPEERFMSDSAYEELLREQRDQREAEHNRRKENGELEWWQL